MYKICLIDDKAYGIPQVIYSVPQNIKYKFYYYDKIGEIENIDFDIVFLDYYLDKDNKTALDIIDKFLGTIIIGFSSEDSKNYLILDNGGSYKAKKLSNNNINLELNEIMTKLLS